MANNSVMNLKVFLRDDKDSEARRFTVDTSVVTSYMFMKEKLQTVFPSLRETQFRITWKDKDADEITIATDDDFITAFTEMSSNSVKTLFVTVVQRNPEGIFMADFHEPSMMRNPRVVCDICNAVITGYRYKCLQCPDYDLCTACEFQGNHSEHIMMRVPNNDMYMPKCARKFMHHLARGLKKSACAANKEAYRAAKYASKFCANPAAGPSTSEENKTQNQEQPSGNTAQEPRRCHFAGGEDDFMNDLHGLGEMAKQHLGPIMDILHNAATQAQAPTTDNTTTGNANNNNDQGGLLADAIRNAFQGFFGPMGESNPSGQAEAPSQPKTPPQSQTSSASPTRPESQKSSAPGSTTGSFETPRSTDMDVDDSKKEEPTIRREPGWTFVSSTANQTAPNATQQADPIAPTVVYHENPRIAEGLVQLHDMGFSNETGMLTHLLERFHGDVSAVVRSIVDMKI